MKTERIYLIGFMGAGKTTVGRALAKQLGLGFLDVDTEFASRHDGLTTGEYISRFGLKVFRFEEQLTLKTIAQTAGRFVVATGGGVPVFPGNLEIMKASGQVVHLSVPLDVIEARMTKEELAKRPVWSTRSKEELASLFQERLAIYNQADFVVDGARETVAIVEDIASKLGTFVGSGTTLEDTMAELGVLPVISPASTEAAVPLTKALCDGGLPLLEITLRQPWAIESIRRIKENFPDMAIGAGTVLTREQAEAALEAGALFIVTPGLDTAIVTHCQKRGVPVFPGCCTPTEITQALTLGLTTLKFFPSELSGGCAALKLFHGPFPHCRFIPTGGLTLENIGNYLATQNVLACGGSFCAPAPLVEAGKWEAITQLCQQCRQIAATGRKQNA